MREKIIVACYEGVELLHVEPGDKLVGDPEGDHVRRKSGIGLFILDFFNLFLDVNLEYLPDDNHCEDNANYSERIGSCVSHRHLLACPVGV